MKNPDHRLRDVPIELHSSHCRAEFWNGFWIGLYIGVFVETVALIVFLGRISTALESIGRHFSP